MQRTVPRALVGARTDQADLSEHVQEHRVVVADLAVVAQLRALLRRRHVRRGLLLFHELQAARPGAKGRREGVLARRWATE